MRLARGSARRVVLPLRGVMTANRVALICTWCSGLAAFVLGVAGALPQRWANYGMVAAGLLTKLVTTLHFVYGSQKYDRIQADLEKARLQASSLTNVVTQPVSTASSGGPPQVH